MKRSHIVTIIAESLIEPHFSEDPEAEASYILERLQKNGMRPPKVWSKLNNLCYNQDGEWEPEDED